MEKGVLTQDQVEEVLVFSRRTGLRFGEAAIALKFLTERRLAEIFGSNFRVNFFHVHPAYLPEATRNLFPSETLLWGGALPLGTKTEFRFFRRKKILNLGLLNPSRVEVIQRVERELKTGEFDSVRVFLILANHFMAVLEAHYGITMDQLRARGPKEICPTLWMFLDTDPSPEGDRHAGS